MVNHWWFITPNIIYQRLPYDSRLVHLVPSLVHLRSTGELRNRRRRPRGFGARLGGAIVEGSARHDNHPAISVGDFMGFSQKHPAIKGYPHLWKSLYIYIYHWISIWTWETQSSELDHGIAVFFLGDLKKSVPVFFHSEHSQLRSRAHTSEVAACSHCNFASNCWCLVQRPCTVRIMAEGKMEFNITKS